MPTALQPVAHRGGHVGGAPGARDRGRAGGLHRGVHAVVAARGEVDQPSLAVGPAAADRDHEARGLGRDRGLEVELVEQQRLQQLSLDPRRGHPQRAARSANTTVPSGHRVHVAGEAQAGQVVEERPARTRCLEVVQLLVRRTASRSTSESAGPRPAASSHLRCGGSSRTNSSNTAASFIPRRW